MSPVAWVLSTAVLIALVAVLILAVEQWVLPIPRDEAPSGVSLVPPLLVEAVTPTAHPPTVEGDRVTLRWRFIPKAAGPGRPPHDFAVTIPISPSRYAAARAEPRKPIERWTEYAAAPSPEVDRLAWELGQLHRETGLTSFEQASNVLSFVQQCVGYEYDWIGRPGEDEWPKYPIESLSERKGDCEDLAILAAAILKRLGFDVALLFMPEHVAIGLAVAPGAAGHVVVVDGDAYLYGEATSTGWRFGDLPPDLASVKITAVRVRVMVEAAA